MVEGPVLVAEALTADGAVEEVFVGPEVLAESPQLAAKLATAGAGAPAPVVYECDTSVLASVLDPRNPRPVAAIVRTPSSDPAVLALDRHLVAAIELGDPGNLGTIARTAEGSGAAGLVVVGPSVDPFGPKTVRAGAGSLLRLPVIELPDIDALVTLAREQDRSLLAADISDRAVPYHAYDLRRAVLMMGNEPHGLSERALAVSDGEIMIPLAPPVESLNVAAAAAVLCFEAARQRDQG